MVGLEKGRKYQIVHRSPAQKLRRASVLVFLDEDNSSYIFSARPVAGTQTMPKEWVLKVTPVTEATQVKINTVIPD